MALSTYDDLVKSVGKWLHRDDLALLIPDFIELCETEMFANEAETLELRVIEKTSTATAVGTPPSESRFLALPPGFLSARDSKITVKNQLLDLLYEAPHAMVVRDSIGTPHRFTVTDGIELDIVPDQDYTITLKYYGKPDPITALNQTNSILTSDPNIYLYGTLHQAFTHSQDGEQAAIYFSKFISAIIGANKRAKKGRYGPAPAMSIKGATP
jgi:hypothetical protein